MNLIHVFRYDQYRVATLEAPPQRRTLIADGQFYHVSLPWTYFSIVSIPYRGEVFQSLFVHVRPRAMVHVDDPLFWLPFPNGENHICLGQILCDGYQFETSGEMHDAVITSFFHTEFEHSRMRLPVKMRGKIFLTNGFQGWAVLSRACAPEVLDFAFAELGGGTPIKDIWFIDSTEWTSLECGSSERPVPAGAEQPPIIGPGDEL